MCRKITVERTASEIELHTNIVRGFMNSAARLQKQGGRSVHSKSVLQY